MANIPLKELVQEIRRQLEELDSERIEEGADPLLLLETVSLELKFTVAESAAGKGGFDLKIVTVGSEKQDRTEAVQTVSIQYRVDPNYQGSGHRAHRSSKARHQDDQGVEPLK